MELREETRHEREKLEEQKRADAEARRVARRERGKEKQLRTVAKRVQRAANRTEKALRRRSHGQTFEIDKPAWLVTLGPVDSSTDALLEDDRAWACAEDPAASDSYIPQGDPHPIPPHPTLAPKHARSRPSRAAACLHLLPTL